MFSEKKGLQQILTGDIKKKVLKSFLSGEKGLKKFFFRRSPREENEKRSLQIFRVVSRRFLTKF